MRNFAETNLKHLLLTGCGETTATHAGALTPRSRSMSLSKLSAASKTTNRHQIGAFLPYGARCVLMSTGDLPLPLLLLPLPAEMRRALRRHRRCVFWHS